MTDTNGKSTRRRFALLLIALLTLLLTGLQLLYPGGLRGLLRDFII